MSATSFRLSTSAITTDKSNIISKVSGKHGNHLNACSSLVDIYLQVRTFIIEPEQSFWTHNGLLFSQKQVVISVKMKPLGMFFALSHDTSPLWRLCGWCVKMCNIRCFQVKNFWLMFASHGYKSNPLTKGVRLI